ncbi:MAG: hypothetical protein ABSB31_08645 [Dehalococcoidia bacterium]
MKSTIIKPIAYDGRIGNIPQDRTQLPKGNMPIFKEQRWESYKIKVQSNNWLRALLGFFSLHDVIPYLYGKDILFDLRIFKTDKKADTEINYKWELASSADEKTVLRHGQGKLNVDYPYNVKHRAIEIIDLSICQQYKIKLRLANTKGTSDFLTIAEFTLKDRDDFYVNRILPIVITTLFGLACGLIGWLLGVIH